MRKEYKLYNINYLDKYQKFIKMFDNNSKINILEILPDSVLDDYLQEVEKCNNKLQELDKDFNYIDIFNKKQLIFKNLNNAKISRVTYRVLKELEKNETLLSNLKSFKPHEGYSNIVEYNQIKTLTGRLVNTKKSPKILTLSAKHRKIFESRWQSEGELYQIDFKSLEPRVIRKINGKDSSEDIYLEIASYLDFPVDRLIIKRAIISILYGSNAQIQGLSKERSDVVLETTKQYFNLSSILDKASKEYKIGCRRNFFGRPIWNIKETQENKLVNNYIQSTAVDISLLYFSELCEIIDLSICKPVFIIHDALIVDTKKDYFENLNKIVNKGYTCKKLGFFPLEIKKLSETY